MAAGAAIALVCRPTMETCALLAWRVFFRYRVLLCAYAHLAPRNLLKVLALVYIIELYSSIGRCYIHYYSGNMCNFK